MSLASNLTNTSVPVAPYKGTYNVYYVKSCVWKDSDDLRIRSHYVSV